MAPRPVARSPIVVFLGDELRRLRHERGYRSVALLVEDLRRYPDCDTLTTRSVYSWERSIGRPEVPAMLALVQKFGVAFEDWFTWPGKKD